MTNLDLTRITSSVDETRWDTPLSLLRHESTEGSIAAACLNSSGISNVMKHEDALVTRRPGEGVDNVLRAPKRTGTRNCDEFTIKW